MFFLAALAFLAVCPTIKALDGPFYDPQTWPNRSGIVHLFEWKWLDIAKECEDFLAPKGYAAVQISPPTENLVVWLKGNNRPWWERYQPMSYRLISRSGNETQFEEMSRRCNAVGIRIYADLVINHMTGDVDPAVGTGGAVANTTEFQYPQVPFTVENFHWPPCRVFNYNDPVDVRNCEVNGFHDLDHSKPYVRDKVVELMNHLIDLGVAGFRVDAAKFMWPQDVLAMMQGMKTLNPKYGFAADAKPFVYQQVVDYGGEAVKYREYTHIGRVVDYLHSERINLIFSGAQTLRWLRTWGTNWNIVPKSVSVVFVDNHENQRDDLEHGLILTYKFPKRYRMAIAFMLAHPNSVVPRLMSSYAFRKRDQGPPMAPNGDLISPGFGPNGECTNGYVCEHRWRQIYNMINFKNIVGDATVDNWWDNGYNQIAFSRGNIAFIAFNNEDENAMNAYIPIGLTPGTYCDIITGGVDASGRNCTGKSLFIDDRGKANVFIAPNDEEGVLAIHVGTKLKT